MAAVTLVSAVVSSALTLRYESSIIGIAIAAIGGGLIGSVIAFLEIFLRDPTAATLRRLPVLIMLGLRTFLYGAVFLGVADLATVVIGLIWGRSPPAGANSMSTVNWPTALGVSFAINFVFTLRALLGTRTLIALVSGRYHRPQREERIVLFLDLHGSTQLAERLGDEDFHRFLNRVFFDLTDPVVEAGGEIYRYVGDEIIVTWTPKRDVSRAVTCAFAIADALAERDADYVRTFGVAPRLRAALHAGPLVIGEIGDVKREIVMLGDTMNTASRIEEVCRATGRDYIVSETILGRAAPLPPGIRAENLGALPLRGKEAGIELFALSRA